MMGKKTLRFSLMLLPAIVCAFLVCAGTYGQAPSAGSAFAIADLAWMAGGWETAPGGRMQIEEHWTRPAGGSMIGMGRTISGGKTVFFEYLRIEARADGIFYVAHPKARPGTDFKLTRLSANEALFENPAHDNPKKILYRKNSDGSLTARIEGEEKGKPVSEEFHYRPMK